MATNITMSRKPAQSIGEFISRDYYQYLINGYLEQHPAEQKSVFIGRQLILDTLNKIPHVSGIRFMYGLKEGADPSSRAIVLMPCNDTSTDRAVPNLILDAKGYLTDEGDRVSLDQCWQMFNRYVNRMCSLMPDERRKDIPRACFYGIDTLKDLLDREGCTGILYHFGYNPATQSLSQRYEAVLEAVGDQRESLQAYVEDGQRCPTACDGLPPGFPFPGGGSVLTMEFIATEKDGALYEMYHYVMPSLQEALEKSGEKTSFSGIKMSGDDLKGRLEEMMRKYLFVN